MGGSPRGAWQGYSLVRIDVLTLFPEMFAGVLGSSILKRAAEKQKVAYHLHQLRDYTTDPHKKVDDKPFGGGPGMVLMCQPVIDAVAAIEALDPTPATRVLLCPQGRTLTQALAAELAQTPRLLLIAGHYEGYDERIRQLLQPQQVSIGDYVLSGGELPAMVLLDAVVRLLPGVLGDDTSVHGESFSAADTIVQGGLEYPHYTRPREFAGLSVPEILLSGNHAAIETWRREQSTQRTAAQRPDLLRKPDPGSCT
jgi:tRNA (guanine37-N1)-methyltransferase